MSKREFTVAGEYQYNRSSPIRWIVSHVLRYKLILSGFLVSTILTNMFYASIPLFTGSAFNAVLQGQRGLGQLASIALSILTVVLIGGVVDLAARFSAEVMGKRLARDARSELYVSLLGKSQTFHNRQRVGDIMARAANDMTQLSNMVVPGLDAIVDSFTSLTVTITFIGFLNPQLLLVPLIFVVLFVITLRDYTRRLSPVVSEMRGQFGATNAGLNEAVAGIEVVKSTAQEDQEQRKFEVNAGRYRDAFVLNGRVQARYLPMLILAVVLVAAFLHGLYLVLHNQFTIGGLVAYMGLMSILRFPTSISLWTFDLLQLGIAGSERILQILREETELDENEGGYHAEMRGKLIFEDVTFSYGATPVLKNIAFQADPGQTVAIVGQTGAGKSSLTKLVNRIYDVDSGRVLIDGVDVRDWSLDALRSQISTIEQDIFLFSRTIAENIAYGLGSRATPEAIEQAARDAQAHDFIMSFKDGYDTVVGERGVTMSGGQRQRIAIARALLTDPRILILDDSTSAIDSATEDEIQKAIRRLLQGRTTLLITHRLSQIRWADKILFIRRGTVIDQGTHDELLERCEAYRRIFVHYDPALPAGHASEVPLHIEAIAGDGHTGAPLARTLGVAGGYVSRDAGAPGGGVLDMD
ncbi:MAG: ABC transporter ATP-binding protein [Ktedonobacteraceae bacterium]|nr:ABC transporter ATP-binding protein [Ktedonobacteraceae bacterium]